MKERREDELTALRVDSDAPEAVENDHHTTGQILYHVVLDFASFVLCIAEISSIIYVSIAHYMHSMGLVAMLMIAPIFLNVIGVTYFMSNKEERYLIDKENDWAKDLFQIPVVGPVFLAGKLLLISMQCTKKSHSEIVRLEASALKMFQAQSFFQSPEALIQMGVLISASDEQTRFTLENYLEIAIVIMSALSLAEAHMYGMISDYFKLFHEYHSEDWKLPKISFGRKLILFFYTFCSIGARITATACILAAARFRYLNLNEASDDGGHGTNSVEHLTSHSQSSSVDASAVLVIEVFLCQMLIRLLLYYFSRLFKYQVKKSRGEVDQIPSGCHEAINYMWRATILDLSFQASNAWMVLWFHVENTIYFVLWWIIVRSDYTPTWVRDKVIGFVSTIFILMTTTSIILYFLMSGLKMHRRGHSFHFNFS